MATGGFKTNPPKPGFRRKPGASKGPSGPVAPRKPSASPKMQVTPEDRARAEQIAARSGIPVEQAMLVAKGRKTLNQVLQEMLARERRDRLIQQGMDRTLAGQVARGHIPLAKARLLQELWQAQGASFKSEALQAMVGGEPVAFGVFGQGVVGGVVRQVERYTVTLVPEGGAGPLTLKKHDIKYYCSAGSVADVLVRMGRHAEVARLGLQGTTDTAERFRPTEEMALDWVRSGRRFLFIFRDGETIAGVPRRVARFEVEVEVAPGVTLCILTHALYKPCPYLRDVLQDS